MTPKSLFAHSAAWLNEHAFTVVIDLALFAVLIESSRPTHNNANRQLWVNAWFTNGALLGCTLLVSWLLSPWFTPMFSDALSSKTGLLGWLGVANISYVASIVAGVLLLDLVIYSLHRLLHAVPPLWLLHQVHHSDCHMNASTHFRQHPLQLVVAMLMQLPALWLLGISGVSWVLYGALSAAAQLWQHAALDHSSRLDRWLRPIFVTPAMHRVHHDHRRQFNDTNYGALFSFWDRLFGTYTATAPDLRLGLGSPLGDRATHQASLIGCLCMPFASSPTPAAKTASSKFQTHLQGRK
jgi:sterol desaturase/sphingolipid hydroxylase (fatty acid hydroxylase superfamily)